MFLSEHVNMLLYETVLPTRSIMLRRAASEDVPKELVDLILKGRHYRMERNGSTYMFYFPDEFLPVTYDTSYCSNEYLEDSARWYWHNSRNLEMLGDAHDRFFEDADARRIVLRRYLFLHREDPYSDGGRLFLHSFVQPNSDEIDEEDFTYDLADFR